MIALALALPASAQAAGTADVDASGVAYQGDAAGNVVVLTDESAGASLTRVTISETGISETSGPDADACQDTGNQVVCVIGDIQRVLASFAGGGDTATYEGARLDHLLEGELGDDTLTGSESTVNAGGLLLGDTLRGGPGRDVLRGRNGGDVLEGGPGDGDEVDAGFGNDLLRLAAADGAGDVLRGGSGADLVDLEAYGAAVADLAGGNVTAANGTRSHTFDGIEDVRGSDEADRLLGTGGFNRLDGGEGSDEIDGNVGADLLEGSGGNDTIFARDGINDRVLGGLGADTCSLDQLDEYDGCENALPGEVPVFGTLRRGDVRGPVCSIRGFGARPARRAVLRGFRVQLFCDERGRIVVQLIAAFRRLPGRARSAATGDLVLGTARGSLGSSRRRTLRLRPGRGLRTVIRRGLRARVVTTVTDAAGNRRIYTRRLRIR
jgi:hypothetical protein